MTSLTQPSTYVIRIPKTRRLQRRSLRLPTRSKSAQTGHLCTTVQAGAVQAFSYVGQNFLVLKWGGGLD